MFGKKATSENTKFLIEILPDGNLLYRVNVAASDNPQNLADIINHLLNGNPYMIQGIIDGIKYFSQKDGWLEKGQFIIDQIIQNQKTNLGVKSNPQLQNALRNPLIKPSQVLSLAKIRMEHGHE